MDKEYLTTKEASIMTTLHPDSIKHMAQSQKIPGAYKAGEGRRGIWQIPFTWVLTYEKGSSDHKKSTT